MKSFSSFLKAALLSVMITFGITSKAQIPTYYCVLENLTLVNPTTFEFDVFIGRTGVLDLYLSTYQLSTQITNTPAVINGGTLTATYVAGSSQLPPQFEPQASVNVYSISGFSYLRVNGPSPSSTGTFIPTNGYRIGKFRVVNSANFLQQPMLAWYNAMPATTMIYAILPPGPTGTSTNITNMQFHGFVGLPDEADPAKYLSVFPNPASAVVNVEIGNEGSFTDGNCTIYDVLGTIVYKGTFSENKFEIDVSKLSKGLYLLRVENDEGVSVKRFVKE